MYERVQHGVAYLGLGSNLGDRLSVLRQAVHAIGAQAGVLLHPEHDVASLYETSPVGMSGEQTSFLNSVVRVVTTLVPLELLEALLSIEFALGRVRRDRREARAIDIDLLLFDDMVCNDAALTLPHPRLHERRFVLEPMCDLSGGVVHPTLGVTMAALALRARAEQATDHVARVAGPSWCASPGDGGDRLGTGPRRSLARGAGHRRDLRR